MQTQTAGNTAISPLELEATTVAALILRVQTAEVSRQMRMLGLDVPGFDDIGNGGGGTNEPLFTIDYASLTNGLWLEITNISNGYAWLNLHNATDVGGVYEIFSKTDLTLPSWNIEGALWPTDTNCQPFVLSINPQSPNYFVWARDWTDITSGGNTTPEWWFWKYYGRVDLSENTMDNSGVHTIGYDYAQGIDPNMIQFSIESTNDYIVNTTSANLQLAISSGNPVSYAVRVNDQTNANWLMFTTTNLTVPIGTTDGVYTVHVGLRGLPEDAWQTWEDYSMTLDRVAPVLTITNPVLVGGTATVIKPYLQLQGFANKQLSRLSYDISNATGIFTNQPCFVTDQGFDAGKFDFTTNFFQCYDVPLATNDNWITLRVTDRAGNTTNTYFDVILDYTMATDPPIVNVIWPQDGAAVCGTNMTVRGTMSDETGTIQAQIVDGDSNTNTVAGLVERNGMFWVEDLPLGNGDNTVTVTATDAAGHMTTTNLTISQSEIPLTIDQVPMGNDLFQSTGTVYGTVNSTNYVVTVNGVQAHFNDVNGAWEADDVPINGMGTATFDAVATPSGQQYQSHQMRAMNSSSGTPPANKSTGIEVPPHVVVMTYEETNNASSTNSQIGLMQYGQFQSTMRVKHYSANYKTNSAGRWCFSYQGSLTNDYYQFRTYTITNEWNYEWSLAGHGRYYRQYTDNGGTTCSTNLIGTGDDQDGGVTGWMDRDVYVPMNCSATECEPPVYITHYFADNVHWIWTNHSQSVMEVKVNARTTMKLLTGGKATIGRWSLMQLQCGGEEYWRPYIDALSGLGGDTMFLPWYGVAKLGFVPTRLEAMKKGVGSDGNVWVGVPDNEALDLGLCAPGKHHYNAWAVPVKYPITITASSSTTNCALSTNTPEFCVGQRVTFTLSGLPEGYFGNDMVGNWQLPPKFVNWQTNYSSTCTNYVWNDDLLQNTNQVSCWFVNGNGGRVGVHLNLHFNNGQYANALASGNISVYRPKMVLFTNYPPFIPMLTNGWIELGNDGSRSAEAHNYGGGMNFMATVEMKTNFPGQINWTQLNNRDVNLLFQSTSGYELDSGIFFGGNIVDNQTNQTIDFVDCPGIETTYFGMPPSQVAISDRFLTYLRFKPGDINDPDNIWVTLGYVYWGWSEEELFGTLIISTNVIPPSYIDCDDWPVWSAVTHSTPGL